MKKITIFILAFLCFNIVRAQIAEPVSEEPTEEELAYYQYIMDSISQSFEYQHGKIILSKGGGGPGRIDRAGGL